MDDGLKQVKDLIEFCNSKYIDVAYYTIRMEHVNSAAYSVINQLPGIHIYTVYPVSWNNEYPPILCRQTAISNRVDYAVLGLCAAVLVVLDEEE